MAVTRDRVIVISHDPILQAPLCRGPVERALITQLTLKQVKEWDCGSQSNPSFPRQERIPGACVPTLDEVFALADRADFDYNIETKIFPDHPEYAPDPAVFAALVVNKVRQYKLEQRVIVQSFDFRTLLAVKDLAPEIRLSALIENSELDFLKAARESSADIIAPHLALVNPANVVAAHNVGLQVIPWTANTVSEWEMLIEANVDAIITDDPGALIEYLRTV
jgi:glycerophosphoryl diester phosphodiesterase